MHVIPSLVKPTDQGPCTLEFDSSSIDLKYKMRYVLGHQTRELGSIGPFRHSDISVKAAHQHGGRVLIYTV